LSADVETILEIIAERIEKAIDELKDHESQNTVGFGYDLGTLDELRYVRNEIKEKFNL